MLKIKRIILLCGLSLTTATMSMETTKEVDLSSLMSKTFSFSEPKLNLFAFMKAVQTGDVNGQNISPEDFKNLLLSAAQSGNQLASQKYHLYLSFPSKNMGITDPKEAELYYQSALKNHEFWAIWKRINEIRAKPENTSQETTEITSLLIYCANANTDDNLLYIPLSAINKKIITHIKIFEAQRENIEGCKQIIEWAKNLPAPLNDLSFITVAAVHNIIKYTNEESPTLSKEKSIEYWGPYIPSLKFLADKGALQAQHHLSLLYENINDQENCLTYAIQAADQAYINSLYYFNPDFDQKNLRHKTLYNLDVFMKKNLQIIHFVIKKANDLKRHDLIEKYNKLGAELGDANCMLEVGKILTEKTPYTASNMNNAIQYLEEALKKGQKKANHYLGEIASRSFEGHPKELQKAINYFLVLVDGKTHQPPFNIGLIYYREDEPNHPRNYAKAKEWFLKAAKLNDYDSMNYLGLLAEIKGNHKEAYQWFTKAARGGLAYSMHNVGRYEALGLSGNGKNIDTAILWLEKAMNMGYVKSINLLAQIYHKNKNDLPTALQLYKKGAELGCKKCSHYVGIILLNEMNRPDDARPYFKNVSKKLKDEALFKLGMIAYNKGNETKAINYFKKSAKLGYLNAMYNLGVHAYNAVLKGNIRKLPKTIHWLCLAANGGFVQAMDILFVLYSQLGNTDQAYYWLKRAQEAKSNFAEMINELMSQESASQTKAISDLLDNHSKNIIEERPNFTEINSDSSLQSETPKNTTTAENLSAQTSLSVSETISSDEEIPLEEWQINLNNELDTYHGDIQKIISNKNTQQSCIEKMKERHIQEKQEGDTHSTTLFNTVNSKTLTIWHKLCDPTQNIPLSELFTFIKDDVLNKYLTWKKTKSGIKFTATYYDKTKVVSTHAKHNKSYDGVDKNFQMDFCNMIIEIFGFPTK